MVELSERARRLDEFLHARGLDAVWFARPNTFSWATGGSNVVDRDADAGCAAVGYDGDGFRVLTTNIEAARLAEEELPEAVDVESYEWFESSLAAAIARRSSENAAADVDVPGLERVDPSPLRRPLSDADVAAYRRLGREAAAAVERVCRELEPDDTERDVASALRVTLAGHDIETPVVLVGGAERAQRYRHYTPTDARLGDYALVSVTAERGGLHASLTRTVAFDPPEWLAERHRAAARVEATALEATRRVGRDGGEASEVFDAIQEAYDALGHPDEWREHHQGGAAGFAGREWVATPTSDATVNLSMGYAWNPTVRGAKSEDTHLVTEAGIETLTETGTWSTIAVEAVDGDLTLERHGVFEP